MLTESDADIIAAGIVKAALDPQVQTMWGVLALEGAILIGYAFYRAWWYAKNNRDFY